MSGALPWCVRRRSFSGHGGVRPFASTRPEFAFSWTRLRRPRRPPGFQVGRSGPIVRGGSTHDGCTSFHDERGKRPRILAEPFCPVIATLCRRPVSADIMAQFPPFAFNRIDPGHPSRSPAVKKWRRMARIMNWGCFCPCNNNNAGSLHRRLYNAGAANTRSEKRQCNRRRD